MRGPAGCIESDYFRGCPTAHLSAASLRSRRPHHQHRDVRSAGRRRFSGPRETSGVGGACRPMPSKRRRVAWSPLPVPFTRAATSPATRPSSFVWRSRAGICRLIWMMACSATRRRASSLEGERRVTGSGGTGRAIRGRRRCSGIYLRCSRPQGGMPKLT
jgi:hypothetical protein